MPREIVVTGMGVVSALGWSLDDTWDSIRNHKPGLRPLTCLESPRFTGWPAGQVPGDPEVRSGLTEGSRSDHLAAIAVRDAISDAGLDSDPEDRLALAGLVLGVTTGGLSTTESYLQKLIKSGVPNFALMRFHDCATTGATLARTFGLGGPRTNVSTACASAASAISTARDFLQRGLADVVLAGGVDSLTRLTVNGFQSLKICDPAGCRPFDRNRRGMTLGEGAAILVLETAESAQSRGARVWAKLAGAGSSCDAYHATAPAPNGTGVLKAMRRALADARMDADTVDYVNAHGTGTLENDAAESAALHSLFEDAPPLISSTKGFHGHALAAAGAIEAVISILALHHGEAPANIGLEEIDPSLPISPLKKLTASPLRVAMSNSIGFSGNNCVLLFERQN